MKFEVFYKEKIYLAILLAIGGLIYGVCACLFLTSFLGFAIGYAIIYSIFKFIMAQLSIGHLKGNAIRIDATQFADIFEILTNHSKKLELSRIPALYILQGNGILNAFATKLAGRNFIVIYSNVLELAYQEGMDVVSFVIGHELGHIKRNHLGFIKSIFTWPGKILIPFLGLAYSRACEYTCDNIGFSLCPEGAARGIAVLAAGKHLYKKINIHSLVTIGMLESSRAVSFAEIFSTHPALIKRITKINQLNREKDIENGIFISPNIENNQVEVR